MLFSISKLILLLVALSIDAFAASFAYGVDRVKIPPASAAIVALISDVILMASLCLGGLLKSLIPASLTVFLSFLILFTLGIIKLFDSAIKKKIKEDRFHSKELHVSLKNLKLILTIYAVPEQANVEDTEVLSPSEAISLGLALSLDSAAAGLGAAYLGLPLFFTAIMAFAIGMTAVAAGCVTGRLLSVRTKFNFSMIGGIILILLAFAKLC